MLENAVHKKKIQNIWLANEYKNKSDIGLFLRIFFGMPFLPPEMLSDVFVYKIIPIFPEKCLEFTDYILDNYTSEMLNFLQICRHNIRLVYNEQQTHVKHFIPN
jgi:hypothetical protein